MEDAKEIILSTRPDKSVLPGGWFPGDEMTLYRSRFYRSQRLEQLTTDTFVVNRMLNKYQCDKLISYFEAADVSAPVGVNGLMEGGRVGSVRTTGWCPRLADSLYKILRTSEGLRDKRFMDEMSSTDWWQGDIGNTWEMVGFSPLLRYMRYEEGGEHFPHYDAGYIYPGGELRSLMSFVLYLTTNSTGATRFIEDGQAGEPVWERDHSDWPHPAGDADVRSSHLPVTGNALFFDHRLCHDVARYAGGEGPRIIIRGDIIFKNIK